MRYWARWIEAIQSATAALSLAEMGAYDRLLDRYYEIEGPIVGDEAACFRICGAIDAAEQAAVRRVLQRFFVLESGAYRNERADEEIRTARPKIEASRANGAKGGRPRKSRSASPVASQEKPNGFPDGNPDGMPAAKPEVMLAHADRAHAETQQVCGQVLDGRNSTTEVQKNPAGCSQDADGNPGRNIVYPLEANASNTEERARPVADTSREVDWSADWPTDADALPPGRRESAPAVTAEAGPYGAISAAVRRATGLWIGVSRPEFRELVDAGIAVEAFIDAAREAVDTGKGAGWAIAAVRGRARDAATGRAAKPRRVHDLSGQDYRGNDHDDIPTA